MDLGSPFAEVAAGILAFLIGAVPFGWLYGRVVGRVDLRQVGSRNVGATNAARLHRGWRSFLVFTLVFLLDAAKGFAAVWLSPALAGWLGGTVTAETTSVVCGSAAILGHVFTPYLSFRGGKGVATALGAVLALATLPAVYAVGVWGVLVVITRYVSLGSIAAMVTIPLTYFLEYGPDTFHGKIGVFVFLLACAGVVIWRHRGNIRRLLKGRERKIGQAS